MNSIRTKTTLITVCAIVATVLISTLLGVSAIRRIGSSSSQQMLRLLCEAGEKNLDTYFNSVEQSVEIVAAFAESDLDEVADLTGVQLKNHIVRVRNIFAQTAFRTNGVLTYYYRLDPAVSASEKGFWFIRSDENGFQEHEVTDISLYDTQDTSRLVWFTVPKATGQGMWLPPYITENLWARVISYNVPVYWKNVFIGVIGIEIDYSTMASEVDHITLYENGYAFINDAQGGIIYHPHLDVVEMTDATRPQVPDGLISDSHYVQYRFDGVDKEAYWLEMSNGMRLNVTVPESEISAGWQSLIREIMIASLGLLVAFIAITLHFTNRMTRPLRELTEAARQVNEGNYDFALDYRGSDEIGILTETFRQLTIYLKNHISDLSNLAYADALTSVHNKGAFDIHLRELQKRILEGEEKVEFALCLFDCNELKQVNDRYGHDKGDIYLQTASKLICTIFLHSPVFRIGGDEFAVILQDEDFRDRAELLRRFERASEETRLGAPDSWKRVDIAKGMAVYDPRTDRSVGDVERRADRLMYENKRMIKSLR